MKVPFFRPEIGEAEIAEVVATLRSGWLTSGPRVKRFEDDFAAAVGARHALALSSCTAALELALDAMDLRPGQSVLVPTMTFAATGNVVLHHGAKVVLVDVDPVTLNLDLADAARKVDATTVGILPVHVGGLMLDMDRVQEFASAHRLWVVEDAAHAFPAAYRSHGAWRRCGENTAAVSCFSFYANKTITTGEGGMATTVDPVRLERMRLMALHGLSKDAWSRYAEGGSWDYRIVAPGHKFNLPDVLAAIGIHQLARAEELRLERQRIARHFQRELADLVTLELPPDPDNRIHAWHLFPVRLNLAALSIDRNAFLEALRARGVGFSVHWRPLHLHPYYAETLGAPDCPIASAVWPRLVTLPLFAGMTEEEIGHVVDVVREVCRGHGR